MEGGAVFNRDVTNPAQFKCFISNVFWVFFCSFHNVLLLLHSKSIECSVSVSKLSHSSRLDLTCIYLPSNFLVLVTNVLLAYLKASPTILVYSLALKSFNLDSISLVQHVDPCGQTSKWSPTI